MSYKPLTWAELSAGLEKIKAKAVRTAWRLASSNPHRRLYLYYRPSTETEFGVLVVAEDCHLHIAHPCPIPTDRELPQIAAWISTQAQHLPLLPLG